MSAPPNDSVLPHLRHPFSKASSDTESAGGPFSMPWKKERNVKITMQSPTKKFGTQFTKQCQLLQQQTELEAADFLLLFFQFSGEPKQHMGSRELKTINYCKKIVIPCARLSRPFQGPLTHLCTRIQTWDLLHASQES